MDPGDRGGAQVAQGGHSLPLTVGALALAVLGLIAFRAVDPAAAALPEAAPSGVPSAGLSSAGPAPGSTSVLSSGAPAEGASGAATPRIIGVGAASSFPATVLPAAPVGSVSASAGSGTSASAPARASSPAPSPASPSPGLSASVGLGIDVLGVKASLGLP